MGTVSRWLGYGLACIGIAAFCLWPTTPIVVAAGAGDLDGANAVARMRRDHFIAEHLPQQTGYTYTLPSRLSGMLAELEQAYGPRDIRYTIVGVEFGDDDAPQVWYPGNRGHVIVQLARNALFDEGLALFQLAHEAVHLLAPSGGKSATVLEEGLASAYSTDYTQRVFPGRTFGRKASYADAEKRVRQLLHEDPGCVARLRRSQPGFSSWTAGQLMEACPRASPPLVQSLLARFVR